MTPKWFRSNGKKRHVLTVRFLARFDEPAIMVPKRKPYHKYLDDPAKVIQMTGDA